jgi:hypothetical protein
VRNPRPAPAQRSTDLFVGKMVEHIPTPAWRNVLATSGLLDHAAVTCLALETLARYDAHLVQQPDTGSCTIGSIDNGLFVDFAVC